KMQTQCLGNPNCPNYNNNNRKQQQQPQLQVFEQKSDGRTEDNMNDEAMQERVRHLHRHIKMLNDENQEHDSDDNDSELDEDNGRINLSSDHDGAATVVQLLPTNNDRSSAVSETQRI